MSVGAYCFGLLKVADNYQLIGNSGDLGIWPVTLILHLHNIGYGFYQEQIKREWRASYTSWCANCFTNIYNPLVKYMVPKHIIPHNFFVIG